MSSQTPVEELRCTRAIHLSQADRVIFYFTLNEAEIAKAPACGLVTEALSV